MLELKGSYNVSGPSHATKIMIPPLSDALQPCQVKHVPAHVQPSRSNRGNRMAGIMANIAEDNDSRAVVSQ